MRLEKSMWKILNKSLRKCWTADRHENQFGSGMADVSYAARGTQGWMELKALPKWPSKPDTAVKIIHFTRNQRIWLLNRGEWGGHTWLMLKVRKEWILFNHQQAQRIGILTRVGLKNYNSGMWDHTPTAYELIPILTK